jgi:hypothetical protein
MDPDPDLDADPFIFPIELKDARKSTNFCINICPLMTYDFSKSQIVGMKVFRTILT